MLTEAGEAALFWEITAEILVSVAVIFCIQNRHHRIEMNLMIAGGLIIIFPLTNEDSIYRNTHDKIGAKLEKTNPIKL